MRRVVVLTGIALLLAVPAALAGAGAAAKQRSPGLYEFVFKGVTSQGLPMRISTRVPYVREGRTLTQGGSATTKLTTAAKVACAASEQGPATSTTYPLLGLGLRYVSSPEGFEITGELGGSGLPARPGANITVRGAMKNRFPTSRTVAVGDFAASALRDPPALGSDICLSGKITFKAKFASLRRVGS